MPPKARSPPPKEVLKALFGFNGLKFPSRMPSDSVLRTIHQLRLGTYPSPQRLRTYELLEIRRVCRLADIPESSLKGVVFPPPLTSLDDLPPSFYLPRGYERDIQAANRCVALLHRLTFTHSLTMTHQTKED